MTNVGAVQSLWRYPVKSMGGDSFGRLVVSVGGVVGDRGWAVRDEVRGGIRGAKKIGALMQLHARYVQEPAPGAPPPPVEMTAPDGTVVRSGDADVNEKLSKALGREVTLWPLQAESDLDHYRRGRPDSDDALAEMRDIFGRLEREPLPDLSGLPLDVLALYESPPGTYFDAYPVHVLTTRSLESLARLAPESQIDVRRFRPNVVIAVDDGVDGEFPEQAWIGRTLRVGGVELDVVSHCPRCVMVTRPTGELPEDPQVLRTVVAHANQNVGVYAKVRTPGEVAVGAVASVAAP